MPIKSEQSKALDEYIKLHYGKEDARSIGARFGTTKMAVNLRAFRMGIKAVEAAPAEQWEKEIATGRLYRNGNVLRHIAY